MGYRLPVFSMMRITWQPLASLRSRLVLLIVMTLLVAQAVTVYVMVNAQRNELQATALNLLVSSVTTLKAAIAVIRPDRQAMFVKRTSQGQWRLVPRPPPKAVLHRDGDTSDAKVGRRLHRLSQEINRALGPTARVAMTAGAQPYLYVSLGRVPGEAPWLQIALEGLDPPVRVPLLMWWLLALTVLIMIALWFSWHITRPITRLVNATDSLAKGRPEPVSPSGPVETKRLGEHFNAMLDALAQTQQAQETLLAGLPHDLKGPMSRMALRIEMTDDEALKAGLTRDLQEMRHMTDQLLDFLRGQDPSRLQRQPLCLDRWLQAQIADRQALGQDVRWLGEPLLIDVNVDESALHRLFDNLVDNALTHGREPVEISLKAKQKGVVVLSVSDHGPGVSPDQHERAFQPFERMDAARSRTGNVGLGLSLVKGIAMAHGGSVGLSAHASGGLTVNVSLPLFSKRDAV